MGLLTYSCMIIPFFWSWSIIFFSFVFSSVTCWSFWFIMVLLLDFRIERSLILFFMFDIWSSSYLMNSFFLLDSFWRSWLLSVAFFLTNSSSLSLSVRVWIWTWNLVIFYPFLSIFYLALHSIYCCFLSHSLFRSSKASLTYSKSLFFSVSYSWISLLWSISSSTLCCKASFWYKLFSSYLFTFLISLFKFMLSYYFYS